MDGIEFVVNALALILSAVGLLEGIPRLRRLRRYWPLLQFWRFSSGATVWIICSEADDPDSRQWPESREFIYLMKYGDIDALFETALTLERIYLNLKIKIMSSREFEKVTGNIASNLICIGGPDYNSLTRQLLVDGKLSVMYRSPYLNESCRSDPDEIALVVPGVDREVYAKNPQKDFGYIERIENPWVSGGTITVLGGNHTIGVTGAAKLFSVMEEGRLNVSLRTKSNYKSLLRSTLGSRQYSAKFKEEKVGAAIAQPDLAKAVYISKPQERIGGLQRYISRLWPNK